MSETIRVWTRAEIEEAAALPETNATMLRVPISMKFLSYLIAFARETKGEDIEIVSAYGEPDRAELRFFKRDILEAEHRDREGQA